MMKKITEEMGRKPDVLETYREVQEKLAELSQAVYEVSGVLLTNGEKDKYSFNRLWHDIEALLEKSEILELQERFEDWFADVSELLEPLNIKLKKALSKNNNQTAFLEKSIF